MKTTLKILLVAAIIGLAYVSVRSISEPIQFDRERRLRDKQVIEKLMHIRSAQIAYRQSKNEYAANFGDLESWLKDGKIPAVRRVMELSEEQLENGLTEQKALEIVRKAEKTGNWKEAEKAGLVREQNGKRVVFSRDTTWLNAKESVFGNDYDLSDLGKVPGTDATFEMDTASIQTASGYSIKVFQAQVPYEVYLKGLSSQEIDNLIDLAETTNRYPGLRVGSLTEINNNAGNWE